MKVICSTLLIENSPQALPLGAACIASAIKHDSLTKELCSVDLEIFSLEDESLSGIDKTDDEKADYIAGKILDKKPDVAALSMYVWNRVILEKVGTVLQKTGVICIAGGPEVTAHPEEIQGFNFLVCGEGEGSVPKIIKNIVLKDFDFAAKPKIIPPEVCKDLSFSPYLDNTLDPSLYGGALWELARGCPFRCSYCYESKGSKIVRQMPMERITAELDMFAKKKISQIFVLDPTYNSNKTRALELLNLIAKKTPDTFYYFEARAEYIDKDLAHAFTKIPCALQIGLQSADENVLKLVNRSFDKNKFIRNIGYLNKEGVTFGFDLIYGLPGETLKGFKNGIDFALSLYPNNLEIFCLSVLPGTDLYERAEELHLSYEKLPPYHVLKTNLFSREDLIYAERLAGACRFFYNEGRSVPWFLSVCRLLKMRPVYLFEKFAEYQEKEPVNIACDHLLIEKIQIKFIHLLLVQKRLEKYERLVDDIIKFNGALARVQETSKSEILKLSYDSEYLASEYASNLEFFEKNVKIFPSKIKIFKDGRYADWKKI